MGWDKVITGNHHHHQLASVQHTQEKDTIIDSGFTESRIFWEGIHIKHITTTYISSLVFFFCVLYGCFTFNQLRILCAVYSDVSRNMYSTAHQFCDACKVILLFFSAKKNWIYFFQWNVHLGFCGSLGNIFSSFGKYSKALLFCRLIILHLRGWSIPNLLSQSVLSNRAVLGLFLH